MESYTKLILPYILEHLRERADQCDTIDNICRNIPNIIGADSNISQENIRVALQQAICIGKNLGILTSRHDTISVPFNFQKVVNWDDVKDTCPMHEQKCEIWKLQPLINNASNKRETKTTHLEPEPEPDCEIPRKKRQKRQETYPDSRPDYNKQVPTVRERSRRQGNSRRARSRARSARRRIRRSAERSRHGRNYASSRRSKHRARSHGRRRRSTRRKR